MMLFTRDHCRTETSRLEFVSRVFSFHLLPSLRARTYPSSPLSLSDIADVSHFVLPSNPMDEEAASRGTTVYLVDKRIDMLPALLGTNLCSLRPYVERLAFSCIWVRPLLSLDGACGLQADLFCFSSFLFRRK